MTNLLDKLTKITKENTTSKKTTSSVNEMLLRVLTKNVKMTKEQLVIEFSKIRFEEVYEVITDEVMAKEDFLERWLKINKTMSDGIDTAWARSAEGNLSSFHNRYKGEYELSKDLNKKLYITKVTKEVTNK